MNKNSAFLIWVLLGLFITFGGLTIASAQEEGRDEFMLEEIIVTGVFDEREKIESTISITTLDTADLVRAAPVSAADLLKTVPGVFVNSSLGEIRNIVYSRGVSASTLEASKGYYYVSMQEDGLPVTNATFVNYGPDYYLRPDATLARLEAVRGGTAAIATTNAPGGIYNYLSKKGGDEFEGLVSVKYGLEGDGENPYKRADFDIGGPMGNGFYYNVGGFYRDSVGGHDAGYDLNYGGQIKANFVKDYGSGSAKLYLKYLDDHNAWFEFNYARNFNNPKLVGGLGGRNGSTLIPPTKTTSWDGDVYDPKQLVWSKDKAIGLDWTHNFGDSLTIKNNIKYTSKYSDWNASAAITAHQLSDFFTTIYSGGLTNGLFGTYDFYDRSTGQTVASYLHSPADFNNLQVLYNGGLKNQNILENGALTQIANTWQTEADEVMDQLIIVKRLESMTFSGGMYYAHSEVGQTSGHAGVGFSYLENQPQMLGIRLTGLFDGLVYQLTNPEGYAGPSFGRGVDSATQDNFALFFSHDWEINEKWNLDWGIRWERVNVDGRNQDWVVVRDGLGGADGDPLTVYDVMDVPDATYHYDKSLDTFAYSLALNYQINDHNSVYLRYSDSEKAPDLSFFFNIDSEESLALDPVPQRLQQYEATYKWYTKDFYLLVTPFYSDLSDINDATILSDETNTPYAAPPLYNEIKTFGIELEGEYGITDTFSVRGSAVWQTSEATTWRIWIANENGIADDTIRDFSGNDADNNPDIILSLEPRYQNGPLYASLAWRYMGERAANVANTFTLPSFNYFDFVGSYTFREKWSLQLNVNNVFNNDGIMSWQAPGNFPTGLDRQGFTPEIRAADPDALFGVIQIPQRAFFLTLSYNF